LKKITTNKNENKKHHDDNKKDICQAIAAAEDLPGRMLSA